jgi:predicted nucleotide-binding protein (sugar kinase/HSP70/actin superfamily)
MGDLEVGGRITPKQILKHGVTGITFETCFPISVFQPYKVSVVDRNILSIYGFTALFWALAAFQYLTPLHSR